MKHIKLITFIIFFVLTITQLSFTSQTFYSNKTTPSLQIISIDTLSQNQSQQQKTSNSKKQHNLTPQQFKSLLQELYKNNYVLTSLKDYLDTITHQEHTVNTDKKPLVLIIENVSYNKSSFTETTVDKLILDRNNEFATYSKRLSIQDRISKDLDAIPILESFIQTHPDFSHNNAKAVLGICGNIDILGYCTDPKNSSSKNNIKRLQEIITTLKARGYTFCSNTYSYDNLNLIDDITLAKNLSLWKSIVTPIVGHSNILSFPFGEKPNNESKIKLLEESTFNVFISNSNKPTNIVVEGNTYLTKRHIDNSSLTNTPDIFLDLFNPSNIVN
ncbi:MAG: hypothetical protein IJW59_04135 [Clostridia bacterium]|nr:hypothetical protein [Clostridia bacterium]